MLPTQVINATKVFAWTSTAWPISSTLTGDSFTICGEVSENYEFQIRKQSELHINLSNKTSSDVSATRRAIRVKFISAKNNKTDLSLTYTQLAQLFQKYVASANEDVKVDIQNNTLDIYAPSTIIGDLRSRVETGVSTPLQPGTKLTFVTIGSTPFVDTSGVTVDQALDVDNKWVQKNVDVEEGMVDFARKYQATHKNTINVKKPQSDDDEWD